MGGLTTCRRCPSPTPSARRSNRTHTGSWRPASGRPSTCRCAWTASSAGSTAPTPRSRSPERRSRASISTPARAAGSAPTSVPSARSRWWRNDRPPTAHRRRGGRSCDVPDRSRRRARLSDHAADADHPDVREARSGREGEHGDRGRGVRTLRDERSNRRRARWRANDDRDLFPGAGPDGRGRLHRRLDARADRHGARQPRALGADQHPLRPLGLDAHTRLRRRPALRRERAGGLRPDGDGATHRRGPARPVARARVPRRLHDHTLGRAGVATSRPRSGPLRRRLPRPERRARLDSSHDAGALRDARLLLRAAPPAGGRTRCRPRRDRRGGGRLRAALRTAARRDRGLPAGGRDAGDRRARLDGRDGQGRRRRPAGRTRAGRAVEARVVQALPPARLSQPPSKAAGVWRRSIVRTRRAARRPPRRARGSALRQRRRARRVRLWPRRPRPAPARHSRGLLRSSCSIVGLRGERCPV